MSISAGAFLRLSDAIMPAVKLDIHKMEFGLTYDIYTSKLTFAPKMREGFEASVSYRDFLNMRISYSQKMNCPVSL